MTLTGLSQRTVSADRSSIAVGPGNQWVDVYAALDPYGLDAIGGRLKTIGVPGLTLIGGFHYFNNKYGWAMDNVLSYDVVLGNGTLVTVNQISHSDLFWALKGGRKQLWYRHQLPSQSIPDSQDQHANPGIQRIRGSGFYQGPLRLHQRR